MNQQKIFYSEYFFPYLKENKIDTVFHFGDFFDNRKAVNYDTLRHCREVFIDPIVDNDINLHMLVGNHDSYYKSTVELTSTKLLFSGLSNKIKIYDTYEEIDIDGLSFLMMPWIFPDEEEKMKEVLLKCTADVVCGHFEMKDVVFQGNVMSRKGLSPDTFSHFNRTFSGHFHKKSEYYIGSPYQMNWSDYDDRKRIILFDTDTLESEDVFLMDDTYVKIEYPCADIKEIPDITDKIVRVVVKGKDNLKEYESFIELIESYNPFSLDIKEEYLYLDVIEEQELDDTDTLSVLLSSIDGIDDLKKGDKTVIKEIVSQLYNKVFVEE
jgi:DNA repair exonuclease SbcCD nuclease subunit